MIEHPKLKRVKGKTVRKSSMPLVDQFIHDVETGKYVIPELTPAADPVNHPHHYTRGPIECIDAIDSATYAMPGTYAHYTATIITYMWRWFFKAGVEDLRKARWYLNRLIAKVEHDNTPLEAPRS